MKNRAKKYFLHDSESLSGGNLVDGLPRALHNTTAVAIGGYWGPRKSIRFAILKALKIFSA